KGQGKENRCDLFEMMWTLQNLNDNARIRANLLQNCSKETKVPVTGSQRPRMDWFIKDERRESPITGQRIVGTQLTVLESVADKCMDTVSLVRTDVENMRMTRVLGLFRMV
ncbi:hypothetical protein D5086_002950, partial [Populus alba]